MLYSKVGHEDVSDGPLSKAHPEQDLRGKQITQAVGKGQQDRITQHRAGKAG